MQVSAILQYFSDLQAANSFYCKKRVTFLALHIRAQWIKYNS